jgi:hypothetical protein
MRLQLLQLPEGGQVAVRNQRGGVAEARRQAGDVARYWCGFFFLFFIFFNFSILVRRRKYDEGK